MLSRLIKRVRKLICKDLQVPKALGSAQDKIHEVRAMNRETAGRIATLPILLLVNETEDHIGKMMVVLKLHTWVNYFEGTYIMYLGLTRCNGSSHAILRGTGRLPIHTNFPHAIFIKVLSGVVENIATNEVFHTGSEIQYRGDEYRSLYMDKAVLAVYWKPPLEEKEGSF